MAGTYLFSHLPKRMDHFERFLIDRGLKKVVKNAARAIGSKVVDTTRVDTGKARSNWRASLGRPIAGVARAPYAPGTALGIGETANASAVKAQQESNIRLYNPRLHRSIFITNRVNYIETLNNGGPRNEADAMVAQGMQAGRVAAKATKIIPPGF